MNNTMNIKKYMMLGGMALTLGMTSSCVGDLDLEPIDPTQTYAQVNDPVFVGNSFAQCYANLAYASTMEPGQSNISAPDAGMSVYTRLLFTINEMSADEAFWIWEDNGLREINTNTVSASNRQVEMCYSRLYQHVAVCNAFLSVTEESSVDGIAQMRDEVRALRALTYYWICDIFGNSPFTVSEPDGEEAPQYTRRQLYDWLEGELTSLVDNSNLSDNPVYGRVGRDGVEALLARLYLNAEVYTDGAVSAWDKCLTRCNNIINRHKGTGFKSSGLAEHYLNIFAGNNDLYMPGGDKKGENEILWGVPFDAETGQSYGGSTFLIAGALSAGDLGSTASWSCLAARKELSDRFAEEPQDVRWSLWVRDGRTPENQDFLDFAVAGYQCLKWSNFLATDNGVLDRNVNATAYGSADVPLIRLADVYLMRAECYLHGQGNASDALEGVNFLRERAGVSKWTIGQLTADMLLDERSRELYFECTRRSDLIRFGKYVGPTQSLWMWKGNSKNGSTIQEFRKLMPIPTNILAAQPSLVQNKGY